MFGFSPPCNMCEIANSDDNMINEWMMVQHCGRNYSKEYDWKIAKEREGCQIFFCKKYGDEDGEEEEEGRPSGHPERRHRFY